MEANLTYEPAHGKSASPPGWDRKLAELQKADARQEADSIAIAFTVIEAGVDRAHPAKTFAVSPNGRPVVSQHGGQPAAGTAHRRAFTGSAASILRALGDTLDGMPSSQALVCAPPPPGNEAWPFTTRSEAKDRSDVISRSRENFPAPAGPALVGLDFDCKAWPADLLERVGREPDAISGIFSRVLPIFTSAAMLRRASSSAGVRNRETGAETDVNAGQHRFFVVKDGRDIGRADSDEVARSFRFHVAHHSGMMSPGFPSAADV